MKTATAITTALLLGAAGRGALAQTYLGNLQFGALCGESGNINYSAPGLYHHHEEALCIFGGGSVASVNQVSSTLLQTAGLLRADGYVNADHGGTSVWGAGATCNQNLDFTADDVVFTDINNPGATGPVQFSVNLMVRTRFSTFGQSNCDASSPRGFVYFELYGLFNSSARLGGQRRASGGVVEEEGSLVAFPNDGQPYPLTSTTAAAGLGNPGTLRLLLSGGGFTVHCDQPPRAVSGVEDFIEISLPRGTPVFNLPPGYTANSVQANIVNNLWQGPCPADYNGDGFVDGIDYDNFMNDFENPDPLEQRRADYNHDGFVDGIDYDMFVNDFETPC